ncbi:hypothetical protein NL676_007449 [Syzygium grande]|nr:hypothetical protein NL676_007449 [Syzygium grande]
MITVDNRNYGSFKYHNATSYISYHGTEVGSALLAPDTIPARAKHDISTSLEVLGDRLVMNTYFLVDFAREVMNFTASTALNGQVKVLKFIKKKATSYTTSSSGWWGPLRSAGPLARGDPGFGSMLARLKFDQASISLLELDLLTRTLTRLV